MLYASWSAWAKTCVRCCCAKSCTPSSNRQIRVWVVSLRYPPGVVNNEAFSPSGHQAW